MASVFYPRYPEGDLHPECEALLRRSTAADAVSLDAMSLEDARADFLLPDWLGIPRDDVTPSTAEAGGIPLRIYTPEGRGPKPVLIFFHGGGFVMGTPDEFAPFCTQVAARVHCIVVSVGYRLAPESPFPAAFDDAWAATEWVAANATSFGGDPGRLAVAGDSAGGNLAAAVSMLARDEGAPGLTHQILICPWVDMSSASEETDSFRHFGEGPWLSTVGIRWYRRHYLRDLAQSEDPRVSPLLAQSFCGLPSALVITAEFDVLADQGRSYAECLARAGVPVVHCCYPGMLHDFVVLPALFTPAWDALDQMAAFSRTAFSLA